MRSFTYDQPASRILFGAGVSARLREKDIGMPADGLDRAAPLVIADPYYNPRPVEYAGIRGLLEKAYHGIRP